MQGTNLTDDTNLTAQHEGKTTTGHTAWGSHTYSEWVDGVSSVMDGVRSWSRTV